MADGEKEMQRLEMLLAERRARDKADALYGWNRPTWDSHAAGNGFMGIAVGVWQDKPGELVKYAFSGGYECYYVLGNMDSLCADCAQKLVDNNIDELVRSRFHDGDYTVEEMRGSWVAVSETIVGMVSMDQQDSCEQCEECGTFVESSGCEEKTFFSFHEGKEVTMVFHGEYCQFYNDNIQPTRIEKG